MNSKIVLDASVVVKIIRDEENTPEALDLLRHHAQGNLTIVIPDFLFIEIANYLSVSSPLSKQTIRKTLEKLYTSSFIICPIGKDELIETMMLAKKHKTSAYDMLYAVVAREYNIQLITADEKFIKKTRFPFVAHIRDFKTS